MMQSMWQGLWILVAGAAGAIVPMAMVEHLSRKQRLIYIGVGMMTATFIAPGINEYMFPDTGMYFRGAVAFVTGLVGLKLTDIVMHLVERRGKGFFDRIANAVLGGHGRGEDKGE